MSSPIVELHQVRKSFGKQKVLDEVTLTLRPGHFYALMGVNGAGKSTLMSVLMRTERFDGGEGRLFGVSMSEDDPSVNARIGYVGEGLAFALPMPLRDFFERYSRVHANWDRKLFEEIVGDMRIDLARNAMQFSRGQRVQIALAAALATRPRLLLLDEVTSVLDAYVRNYFMERLAAFTRDGGTVVLATNVVSEVHGYADHVVLLHHGQVKEVLAVNRIGERYVKLRRGKGRMHAVFSEPECVDVGVNSDGSVSCLISKELAEKLAPPAELVDQRQTTAEEVFIFHTHEERRAERGKAAA